MRKSKIYHCHKSIKQAGKTVHTNLKRDIRTIPFFSNRRRTVASVAVAVSFLTFMGLKMSQVGLDFLYNDRSAGGATDSVQLITNEPKMGTLEGTGTHFELTDSQYLNITVDSTVSIELSIESSPEIIVMRLDKGSTDADSANITLGGFRPSATYHKYQDGYENHETFVSDKSGQYIYSQDLSERHLVFIQPRPSTKFIKDDETGGDCGSFGTWDASLKTCQLTSDLGETIEIQNDNVTLDGNGHKIAGSGTGNGVYLSSRSGIKVKNLRIENFFSGIYAYRSNGNEFANNTILNSTHGIYLDSSANNKLSGNSANSNKIMGIRLYYSDNNELVNNTTNTNYYSGVYFNHSNGNMLSNNTASNNNPNIPRTSYQQGGFNLINSSNNTFESNTTNSNYNNGIVSESSNNNVFSGGTISNNVFYGIVYIMSSSNSITGNVLSGNSGQGIYLWGGQGNIISSNKVSGGSYSIAMNSSNNNTVYNNLFKNNSNASIGALITNSWNIEKTSGTNIAGGPNLGGNYWTNVLGTGFSDKCADNNGDGICDVVYTTNTLNIDNLPLAKPDVTAPATTASVSGTMGDDSWYVSNIEVTLAAADNAGGTGVAKTEYSFDNANWNVYFSPFVFSNEGESMIYYRSVDKAGNTEEVKNIFVKIDKTSAAITGAPTVSANADGWYKQGVTVRFNCNDTISGAVEPSIDRLIDGEGTNLQASGQCKDKAGNVSELTVGGINIDKTAPTVSVLRSPDANSRGWNNVPVSVAFAASDSLSGISGSQTNDMIFNKEGAGQSAVHSFQDKAGNSATASISNINIDLTAPSIVAAATKSPNENGWYNTNVTVHFTASDSLSGLSQVSPDATLANEGANQQATGSAEDIAGNRATATLGGINLDKTPPVISGEKSTLPNENGWYNSDVMIKFSAQDELSGVESVTPAATISTEGMNRSASGAATDKAGNESSIEVGGVNLDKTSPVITGAATTSPNASGWYNDDVTIHYSAADALSGIGTVSPDSIIAAEGANQSATGMAKDNAGNSAEATVDGINIDKSAPETAATLSGVSSGACTNTDVGVTLAGNDVFSGIAGISYNIDNGGWLSYLSGLMVSSEGQHLLKYYSADKADNTEGEKSVSFEIEKMPPEAAIKFDPQSQDVKVYNSKTGEEASFTVVTKKKADAEGKAWDVRQYVIKGCGTNSLTLTLNHRKDGNEVKVDVVSVQYANGAKQTFKNGKINVEYSKKGIAYRTLNQKIDAEKLFVVEAKYNAAKGTTDVKVKLEGKNEQKNTVQGMTVLQLLTDKGTLKYKY